MNKEDLTATITNIIQQELMRATKGKCIEKANFAEFIGYVGNSVINCFAFNSSLSYSGATFHMCSSRSLMSKTKIITSPVIVHLPDGSIKTVKNIGEVKLRKITLKNVLYVPDFKHNLLSVQLLRDSNLGVLFY